MIRLDPETRAALEAYSLRFYAGTLSPTSTENYIASPLGAWILLAVLAASTDFSGVEGAGDHKSVVEETLGLSVEKAGVVARELLTIKGADISVAAWFDSGWVSKAPRIASWLDTNELGSSDSRVPSQEEMDAWTKDVTHGLITKFPVAITPETMFLVASVIYTKFSWEEEYDVISATEVSQMAGWNSSKILSSDGGWFVDSEDGLLAVHTKRAAEHSVVFSVMALESDVSDEKLLAHAHNVQLPKRVSYADAMARLADTNSGFTQVVFDAQIIGDKVTSYLPAWEADNSHDLSNPLFGFYNEAETLAIGFDEYDGFKAAQSVVAKYGAKGFEAAAVTAFGMMRSSAAPMQRGGYKVSFWFGKPYAVLCVTEGIPTFAGIVKKATEA